MKHLWWMGLFLPGLVGAQALPAKANKTRTAVANGTVMLLRTDTTSGLVVDTAQVFTPAGDTLTVRGVQRSGDTLIVWVAKNTVRPSGLDTLYFIKNRIPDSLVFSSAHLADSIFYPLLNGRVKIADSLTNPPPGQNTMANSLPVTLASDQSGVKVEGDSGSTSVATGALGALGNTVALSLQGKSSVSFVVDSSQSLHGVVVVEVETNAADTNWDSRYIWNGDACVGQDSLPNGNGINKREYTVPVQQTAVAVRLRVSGYTSGSAKGIIRAGPFLGGASALPISCSFGIDSTLAPGGGYGGDRESPVSTSIGGRDETATNPRHRTTTVTNGSPALNDFAVVMRPANNIRVSGPTTLSALNNAVTVRLDGMVSAGIYVAASTLSGTLLPEVSFDSTNWVTATVIGEATLTPLTTGIVNPGAQTAYTLLLGGGWKWFRARVSAFVSGSSAVQVNTTSIMSELSLQPLAVPTITTPAFNATVGGVDTAGLARTIHFHASTSIPTTSETPITVTVVPNSAGLIFPQTTDSIGWVQGKNAADSILLPAKAGLRHYITAVCWAITDSLTGVAAAAPDTVTTTNLPATPTWLSGNLLSGGGQTLPFGTFCQNFTRPLVATTANTITKFRGNATGAHSIETLEVHYYLAP